MKKNEKIMEVDLLRGFGALAVIAIHLSATFVNYPSDSLVYLVFGILNKVCHFAVPLFLFISAFGLMFQTIRKEDLYSEQFYTKRLGSVVWPYLFWTIVYLLYYRSIDFNLVDPVAAPGEFLLNYLVLGKSCYHLYFMPVLIQFYLIFPVIWEYYKKHRRKIHPLFSMLITFGVLAAFQFIYLKIYWDYLYQIFPYSASLILAYMIPIGMGVWVACNFREFLHFEKPIKVCLVLLAILTGAAFTVRQLFPEIGFRSYIMPMTYAALISMVLLYFSDNISHFVNPFVDFIEDVSNHSLTIYLVHPLVLLVLENNLGWDMLPITGDVFWNYLLNFVLKYICVFEVSIVFARCVRFILKKMGA
ncbi:MAG: acyltransferase [Clostridia bacterium]|nr:acyltransferase [Clostridia bacterium]